MEKDIYQLSNLTPEQLVMWAGQKLHQDCPIYNVPCIFTFNQKINLETFQKAFQLLLDVTHTLKTVIREVEGIPQQMIIQNFHYTLENIDLTIFSDSSEQLEIWLDKRKGIVFNLEQQLFDSALIKKSENEFIWYINQHHIITDGWSISLLLKIMSDIYEKLEKGLADKDIGLPLFLDYAEKGKAQTVRRKNSSVYWENKLNKSKGTITLYGNIHSKENLKSKRITLNLDKELVEKINALITDNGISSHLNNTSLLSFFMIVLALCLHVISGENSFLIGTPIHNRRSVIQKNTVGLFMRIFPILIEIDPNESFSTLMKKVKSDIMEVVRNNQYINLDYINRNPYSAFVNYHVERFLTFCGKPVIFDWLHTGYDFDAISLQIRDFDSSGLMKLDIDLNQEVFQNNKISRVVQQFMQTIRIIINNPNEKISHVDLISEEEKEYILKRINNQINITPRMGIVQLIDMQTKVNKDRIAVVFGDIELTYSELGIRSNSFASYLTSIGMKTGDLIGVYMDRSIELIIVVVSILKIGATFVPLDLDMPLDRLDSILKSTQLAVTLTVTHLLEKIQTISSNTIDLQLTRFAFNSQGSEFLSIDSLNQNIAYIIHTSGSTGKPKGVMVTYHNITSAYYAWASAYLLNDIPSHLQMANFCFDVFMGDLVRALCSGAKLCICPREILLEPNRLYDLMVKENIYCAEFVPAVLRSLLSYLKSSGKRLDIIKILIVGSDVLYGQDYIEILNFCNANARIINSYGLSETTVDSSYFEGHIANINSLVPIGRPYLNTQIYILDKVMRLVPFEVIGEIYIGGDGVSSGYYNQPDLTASHFVPNIYSTRPGDRLYKTGDLARYLPDGNIEFIGRFDNQIKVRGFRIEIEEIEYALLMHPDILQTAVIFHKNAVGEELLVAYVVVNQDCMIKTNELRSYLQQKLHIYMVPALFIFLDSLPVTTNGKVKRNELPMPELDSGLEVKENKQVEPYEELLVNIWSKFLKIQQISIYDNFFELGGHSLLATQIVFQMEEVFGIKFPLNCFFMDPTISGMIKYLENINLISTGSTSMQALHAPRTKKLVLSFGQQRLLFLDQLSIKAAAYNISVVYHISGHLNVSILEESIKTIVMRHEILRTSYVIDNEMPYQNISEDLPPLNSIDLQSLTDVEKEDEIKRLKKSEACFIFDLSVGPVLRTMLLKLNSDKHVLIVTVHHIAFDGWSTAIFSQELELIYKGMLSRQVPKLAELTFQYADFAYSQRKWVEEGRLKHLFSYWKEQLADVSSTLMLPFDHRRPAIQTYRGSRKRIHVSKELSLSLKNIAKQEGVTLFMALLSVFKILLYRYSGQHIIVVGSPIANRANLEYKNNIGFFVNTLALKTQISGKMSFLQVLQEVKEVTLGAYTHQDVPFDMVMDIVQPERNLSHHPLFQVFFVLQNDFSTTIDLPNLTIISDSNDNGTAKFDLLLDLTETSQGIDGYFEYSTDLFEEGTVTRMIENLLVLLHHCTIASNQYISRLSLISFKERQIILNNSQINSLDLFREVLLCQMLNEQIELTPNTIAVICNLDQLTYKELNDKTNQLANHLRELELTSENVVGIYMNRSVDLIIGIIGVIKAGCAYIPLDPSLPKERINYMLNDSQVAAVLTHYDLHMQLRDFNINIINLHLDAEIITTKSIIAPSNLILPDNLIYIIYTSGSTGNPKGVAMTHRSMGNLIQWHIKNLPLRGLSPRVLQFAPLGFDVSFQEIFSTLCLGGTLIIPAEVSRNDIPSIWQTIVDQNITRLFLPFVALQQLAETAEVQSRIPANLTEIITAGEQLQTTNQIKNLFRRLGQCTLHNHYGPSESHVVTVYSLAKAIDTWPSLPSIGKPISNTETYILDDSLQLVPIGVSGELYIGGVALARGYINRPDFTAEKFVPHPYSKISGERLYKTGDLARYNEDGTIDFLGRIDHQVKIRGYRIELSEIEVAIAMHKNVRECVVIVNEITLSDKRIVAYIVLQDIKEEDFPITHLRNFLKEKLPEYMVPSIIVFLDTLPLNHNGKVDRHALPLPQQARPHLVDKFVGPLSDKEHLLAKIWRTVLKLDQVGVHDNFFELGGDSILAMQTVTKANSLGLGITLRQLLQNQTISELVATESRISIQAEQNLVIGPVPIVPTQQRAINRTWFDPHLNTIGYWLTVQSPLTTSQLELALQTLIEHHDALRLRFEQVNGEWKQFNASVEENKVLHHINISDLSDHDKRIKIVEVSEFLRSNIKLSSGPLIQVAFFQEDEIQIGQILIVIHHLIVDAVSLRIIIDDLETACQDLKNKRDILLLPKTTSFRYYAETLAAYAKSLDIIQESVYWVTLANKTFRPLSSDYPNGAGINEGEPIVSLTRSFGLGETKTLMRDTLPVARAQITEVLLLALTETLATLTNERQICLRLAGHGRDVPFTDIDLSRTVGWFSTSLPILIDLRGTNSIDVALRLIKEQLADVPSQGIGYSVLRYTSRHTNIIEQLKQFEKQIEVTLNFGGQINQEISASSIFIPTGDSDIHFKQPRTTQLRIAGHINWIDGGLQLEWMYNQSFYRHSTIANLAENYFMYLHKIISYFSHSETGSDSH